MFTNQREQRSPGSFRDSDGESTTSFPSIRIRIGGSMDFHPTKYPCPLYLLSSIVLTLPKLGFINLNFYARTSNFP
jgi:hypothetical protein